MSLLGAGGERTQEQIIHCFQSSREEMKLPCNKLGEKCTVGEQPLWKKGGEGWRGARGKLKTEKLPVSGGQVLAQPPWELYSDRVSYTKNKVKIKHWFSGAPENSVEKPREKVGGLVRIILTSEAISISGKQMEKSGTKDAGVNIGWYQGMTDRMAKSRVCHSCVHHQS